MVNKNELIELIQDGKIWIKTLREGINAWCNIHTEHCGVDARMESVEGWYKRLQMASVALTSSPEAPKLWKFAPQEKPCVDRFIFFPIGCTFVRKLVHGVVDKNFTSPWCYESDLIATIPTAQPKENAGLVAEKEEILAKIIFNAFRKQEAENEGIELELLLSFEESKNSEDIHEQQGYSIALIAAKAALSAKQRGEV